MESDFVFWPHIEGFLPDSTEEVGSEQDESEEEVAIEEEASASQEEDFGVEYLLKQDDREGEGENDSAPAPGPKKEITDIAAAAESLQPKGYTLATTQVSNKEAQQGR